ncbi:MAG: helix-turn-helix domain-containing protein [Bacteroidetes bacterium]|nr:helix-turn-helix domain-containing protein [Bacteroidota bacterium]
MGNEEMVQLSGQIGQVLKIVSDISERLPSMPLVHSGEFMTADEAAAFLNLSIQTVYGMTHRKAIPHFRRGKRLTFRRSELVQWVSETRRTVKGTVQQ